MSIPSCGVRPEGIGQITPRALNLVKRPSSCESRESREGGIGSRPTAGRRMFACALPLVLRESCLLQVAGMADAVRIASTGAVCSHTDDAVGSIMPGGDSCCSMGALRAPWISSRGRGRPCRLPNAYGSLWSCSSRSGAHALLPWTSQACKRVRESLPRAVPCPRNMPPRPTNPLRCWSPNGGKGLRQTRVRAQPSSVVNYNGRKRVTCPVPEDDPPIVSAGVAMVSP
jgi:hypothetical protein